MPFFYPQGSSFIDSSLLWFYLSARFSLKISQFIDSMHSLWLSSESCPQHSFEIFPIMGLWFTPGQGKHGVKIKRLEKFQTMAEKAKDKNYSTRVVPMFQSQILYISASNQMRMMRNRPKTQKAWERLGRKSIERERLRLKSSLVCSRVSHHTKSKGANENSLWTCMRLKRGRTRATKSWLILVLNYIGWEGVTSFCTNHRVWKSNINTLLHPTELKGITTSWSKL